MHIKNKVVSCGNTILVHLEGFVPKECPKVKRVRLVDDFVSAAHRRYPQVRLEEKAIDFDTVTLAFKPRFNTKVTAKMRSELEGVTRAYWNNYNARLQAAS